MPWRGLLAPVLGRVSEDGEWEEPYRECKREAACLHSVRALDGQQRVSHRAVEESGTLSRSAVARESANVDDRRRLCRLLEVPTLPHARPMRLQKNDLHLPEGIRWFRPLVGVAHPAQPDDHGGQ